MHLQKFLDLTKKPVFLHTAAWIFFALFFFLTISGVEPPEKGLKTVMAIFLPSIPAVYLHLRIFAWFLKKKKYFLYVPVFAAIVFSFGRLIDYVVIEIVYPDDENVFIASELVLIVFILVATGLKYFFIGMAAGNRLVEIEAKQHKAELDSLRMQVNPHFLFNSLNNIYGLMNENTKRAGESLLTLSGLLRYLIYASEKSGISLEEEIKFVDDYIAMERLRLGEKCSISVEKAGDFSGYSLSPFLLMPFVENAFKHGSFATIKESYVLIEAKVENDTLFFNVQNSINANASSSEGGVGISNAKRRLELLLPDAHELSIKKHTDFFEVKLTMKLS